MMYRSLQIFLLFVILGNSFCLTARTLEPLGAARGVPRYILAKVERVVAVGDIHADPVALVSVLYRMRLIDEMGQWTGGKTNLVMMGDIVGKGDDSRTCLNLLYVLGPQAERAGGAIHLLVGNHEIYHIEGTPHAPSQAEQDRYRDFGENGLVEAFRNLRSPYARELRRRNTFLRIGRTLFAHADLGQQILKNPQQSNYLNLWNQRVRRHIAARQAGDAAIIGDLQSDLILDRAVSPLNSRTIIERHTNKKEIKAALEALGADRIVLGHTPTESGEIESHFGKRVWITDTRMSQAMKKVVPSASHLSALEIVDDMQVTPMLLSPVPEAEAEAIAVRALQGLTCPELVFLGGRNQGA